ANKIHLIGTEAGLGVNNGGIVSADGGDLVLLANGWLTNKGALLATGNATLTATGAIDNIGGQVLSAGALHLSSQGLVNDGGQLQAQADAHIDTHGGDLSNRAGQIGAQGALQVQAGQVLNEAVGDAVASIGAGHDLNIQAAGLNNSAPQATLWAAQAMAITTPG